MPASDQWGIVLADWENVNHIYDIESIKLNVYCHFIHLLISEFVCYILYQT